VFPGIEIYRTHKPNLLSIKTSKGAAPLIAWARGHETKATVCDIAKYLQRPVELVHLMDRIEREDGPSPLQRIPAPPCVNYPGRWLRGKAPCSSLSRIEISGSGEVRCCRHGEPIGKVGDARASLSKRLARLKRVTERRRGCAKCSNSHCPRCPFPGVDDRTYCGIMAKQEPALRLLDWIQLYSRLPLLLVR